MRVGQCALLLAIVLSAACGSSRSMTAARSAAVEADVRAFARTVAHDVTQEGPSAWRRHFSDSPAFFMASEGHLVFPNSASVTAAIPSLVRTFKHIDLQCGDDLRVDPLTPDLAVVAATYHEVQTNAAGDRMDETGYFTGLAEYRDGRWQFRNAHWSVATSKKS